MNNKRFILNVNFILQYYNNLGLSKVIKIIIIYYILSNVNELY